MPSEQRLHPFSIFFAFLTQVRIFVVPGILLMLGIGRGGGDWWSPWMMLLVIPSGMIAALRYFTYRYRYDGTELVIRTGLIFRRERHIPYARIQNIDAVQNVLHRLLHVVEVKIETGGSESAEATMSVLPLQALHEMRERVFAERRAVAAGSADATDVVAAGDEDGRATTPAAALAPTSAAPPLKPLLRLSTRELMLSGFIDNRGAVVVAAAFGLIWELGIFERFVAPAWGGQPVPRGVLRDFFRNFFSNATAYATVSWERVALTVLAFLVLLLVVRVLSMGWAVVRLHGFTLALVNGDARTEYGLLTRVTTTIPLRRVQALAVTESPLHRRFVRVSVRVDTAGGRADESGGQTEREALAPILPRETLPSFVRAITGTDIERLDWRSPAPGAFRREVKGWLFFTLLPLLPMTYWFGWWSLVSAPLFVLWAVVGARQTIKHLGWTTAGDSVIFKRGWLWRRMVVVRFAKIQVVTRLQSPFDRRRRMATLHVDTAGASSGHVIAIPYLALDTAEHLHAQLAFAAARTEFQW